MLDALSEDERGAAFEASLNRRTLRVYDLRPERIRIDSTTASGYWQVTEDGLFQGNSKRATERPTTEALLRAFKGIFLSFVQIDGRSYRHITPLSELQRKILDLLDIPASIYSSLTVNSIKPP